MNLDNFTSCATLKRKIVLHGDMGEIYGREFEFAVRSPAEAVRLFQANFNTFIDDVKKRDFQILFIPSEKDKRYCTLETVTFCFPAGEFHFIPQPAGHALGGGNKGMILTIVGVALIATAFLGAGFLAGGFAGAGWGTAFGAGIAGSAVTWGQLGLLGLALTLLGVSALLTPTPKKEEEASQARSFFFSGAVNSAQEGGPVPIVYGRVMAGSVIIHAGVSDNFYGLQQNVPSEVGFEVI